MSELTAEVTNKPDHAEIRINGYLSADSVMCHPPKTPDAR